VPEAERDAQRQRVAVARDFDADAPLLARKPRAQAPAAERLAHEDRVRHDESIAPADGERAHHRVQHAALEQRVRRRANGDEVLCARAAAAESEGRVALRVGTAGAGRVPRRSSRTTRRVDHAWKTRSKMRCRCCANAIAKRESSARARSTCICVRGA